MISINPDKEKVKEIREKIKVNDGYCCCMILRDETTKCPCKDLKEKEECICELYIKI